MVPRCIGLRLNQFQTVSRKKKFWCLRPLNEPYYMLQTLFVSKKLGIGNRNVSEMTALATYTVLHIYTPRCTILLHSVLIAPLVR